MMRSGFAVLAGMLLAVPCAAVAQGEGARLQGTLAKLDAASEKFQNAQATFSKETLIKLVGDRDTQNGSVYFIRTGRSTQAGVLITGAGARVVEYKNGIVRDYLPQRNCYNTMDSSANKAKTESALTLGFGNSGKDLAAAWEIMDDGPETVAGVKTEKLELVSKSAEVRNTYSKVTLWMDLERGVSIKQLLVAPQGDTTTAMYANIRLNQKSVDTKPFEFKGNPCR